MKTVQVERCPIDGAFGAVGYDGIRDAFFGTPGNWCYRRHGQSGHLWLDPRPDSESIAEIYENYHTRSGDDPITVGAGFKAKALALWHQALAVALSARLGYSAPERPALLAKLAALLPSVGASAELEVMRIPASEKGRMLDFGCGAGALRIPRIVNGDSAHRERAFHAIMNRFAAC